MVTYVALLRGINVGGTRKVEMKLLRETFQRLGMNDVQTYINSGNVVFRNDSKDAEQLRSTLERAVEMDFGFAVRVLVRDAHNISRVVGALPDSWANDESAKCDAIFLGAEADSPSVLDRIVIKPEIDEVIYVPGALLWRVERTGVTRSGLLKLGGTDLYAQATVRNCNTLRRIAALMH
jgi:uncharacterized protein (DUF1697 family)